VLLVLFHHLSPATVPGGFVGVDIFFVISGFLITAQLFGSMQSKQFTYREFYRRRINRIMPALAMVCIAAVLAGVLFLSPLDLELLTRSAFAALTGSSNILLWREYGSYFGGNASEAPLLHTWSLGVEEQFYLLWPMLLAQTVQLTRRTRMVTLTILMVGSFGVSIFMAWLVPSAAYYLLPSRFFELLLGSAVALALQGSVHLSSWIPKRTFTVIGLFLILVPAMMLSKRSIFPGWNALYPCLGAALLILAGSERPIRFLALPPLVGVGLISYSLYLWHWPIIAFLNYRGMAISLPVAAGVVAASMMLAFLSWRFVETPVRETGAIMPLWHVVMRRLLVPIGITAAFAAICASAAGFPTRFDHRVHEYELALLSRPEQERGGCHVPAILYERPIDPRCSLGGGAHSGLLIGDSFANHFSGMVDVLARASSVSVIDHTMASCPPLLGYRSTSGRSALTASQCAARNDANYTYISATRPELVLLAANWPLDGGEALHRSVKQILSAGSRVAIILNNPHIPNAASCVIRAAMKNESVQGCTAEPQPAPGYIASIKLEFPEVQIIDPNLVICADGRCRTTVANQLIYRDDSHLTDVGSRLIGDMLLKRGVRLLAPDSAPR
jgi:peptidoglycan/LPS O-acetylase OafA/YrhL